MYLFPHALQTGLRHYAHPSPPPMATLVVDFQHDKVMGIRVNGTSLHKFHLNDGGIAIGDPVAQLLQQVRTKPDWSLEHEGFVLYPYPISVGGTHRIGIITIGTTVDTMPRGGSIEVPIYGPGNRAIAGWRVAPPSCPLCG